MAPPLIKLTNSSTYVRKPEPINILQQGSEPTAMHRSGPKIDVYLGLKAFEHLATHTLLVLTTNYL